MKHSAMLMMLAALACSVSACGSKGGLKTPSRIEADRVKKEHQQALKDQKAAKAQQDVETTTTAPVTNPDQATVAPDAQAIPTPTSAAGEK